MTPAAKNRLLTAREDQLLTVQDKVRSALEEAFPKGTRVSWTRNGSKQYGEVLLVRVDSSVSFRVRNEKTGAAYFLHGGGFNDLKAI